MYNLTTYINLSCPGSVLDYINDDADGTEEGIEEDDESEESFDLNYAFVI